MTPVELQAALQAASDALRPLHEGSGFPAGLSNETTLAIGSTMGMLLVAKALVGRDIDDARVAST
jgi:hypothetical protein